MSEAVRWLREWHAAHRHGLHTRGISVAVKQPGTPSRGRPKAAAAALTLESDGCLGKVYVWGSGSASLLFVDLRTEYTWQGQEILTSEDDLPRILAPLVELVEAATERG